MSKLSDFEFPGLPVEVVDFKDDVRDLLNNGKYQAPSGTGTPSYSAGQGELYLQVPGTGGFALWIATSINTWSRAVNF